MWKTIRTIPKTDSPSPRRAVLPSLVLTLACSAEVAGGIPFPLADTSSAALERYIQQVQASYRDVRTLRAEFKQTYRWGARVRVESGTVTLARGGLMRWDYKAPEEKVFISEGKRLLLYVPAERQLTRSAVNSTEDVRVPFRLLLSRVKLRRVFRRIEFADASLHHAPEDRVLRAYPKPGYDQDYREVLIELTPKMDVRRLVVTQTDGSAMEFEFEDIQRNVPLRSALFRFVPPPGTEIIDQK